MKISQSDNRLIFTDITMEEFNGFFREYFDIDRDYGKIKKYLSYDEILRKAERLRQRYQDFKTRFMGSSLFLYYLPKQ